MKVGVHLPNDGLMSGEDFALVEGLGLVKGLVRLDVDWGEVDWRRLAEHIRPDCAVVLRLYCPGRLEAQEFIRRSAERLPGVLEALGHVATCPYRHVQCAHTGTREILIEIHNEPNHAAGIEGWGSSDDQARDFAAWYAEVLAGLRDQLGSHSLPSTAGGLPLRFGWPGLALGEWAHRERSWAEVNRANIRASDWIGVHCYWQRPEEVDHPQLGGNWRWYRARWPRRRVIVTEAGNSSCHNPELPQMTPERQQAEYLAWCRAASAGARGNVPVQGVAFYMLGGSEEWRGFRLWPETVRALASARALAGI